MCYGCIQVAKGKVTPKQFWSLYRELMETDDPEHVNGLLTVVKELPEEARNALAAEALDNEAD